MVTTLHFLDPTNGNAKSRSQSTFQARDRAGRKRDEVETPRPDGQGGIILAHEVSVGDPVSHCSFRWMEPVIPPAHPLAIVSCMTRTLHYTGADVLAGSIVSEPRIDRTQPGIVDSTEPLGKRMFGDLEAVGVRNTRSLTQDGKRQRLVTEMWYSPALKEMLELREMLNPGENEEMSRVPDFELTNIHRGQPDEALFYPPPGYDIETGH